MNEIMINNAPVQVKEYNGMRVVTLKDIDAVHGRPDGTARKRFNDNKDHFIEGEDYFKVCASEIRTHKIMEISAKTHEDVTLITESGYLMLVKSFTDDLAWEVQRQLVNCYFRVKQETNLPNMSVMEMIAHIANNAVETEKRLTAIEATQEEHTQQIQDTNSRIANIHTVFADNLSDTFEDDVKKKVNAICQATGKSHVVVYAELYHAVNAKAGCDIKRRQQNIISRKMKQGYSKTAATNSTSQLTVIAADKTLKNVCQMVLKQLCAEYLEF